MIDQQYLDPDSWYSPADVFHQLRISPTLQEEARSAEQLTFVHGGGVRYRGSWVNRWIADGAPCEKRIPAAECSAAISISQKDEGVSMKYSNPRGELQRRIDLKMQAGKPRHIAHTEAMKEDPELRRDLLTEANANRPHALHGIR